MAVRWANTLLALALGCSALACSDSAQVADAGAADAASPPDGASDAGPTPDAAGPDAATPTLLSRTIGPVSAGVGEEDTVCITINLNNPAPVRVTGIETHLSLGSHHMIVYAVDRVPDRTEPSPCFPFADVLAGGKPLFIAQQEEAAITYPEGTAFELQANQSIKMEMHYINLGGGPADITGTVDFQLAEPDAELEAVDMIFWGTTDINVPPRASNASTMFRRVPGPTASQPSIKIFGLTSHTHQLGELAVIERAPSLDGAATAELHTSTTWAEPPLTIFDPPVEFDGSDGLRLICNYDNPTDRTVGFGEGFAEEMCFLWAYYYPSRGFLIAF